MNALDLLSQSVLRGNSFSSKGIVHLTMKMSLFTYSRVISSLSQDTSLPRNKQQK